ncbi:hypothetical protein NVP1262O_10 [Vibrio phage 1.262.O._10N.286.51.A9]|nr:hypothetical protein NVP1262O_10 [Vibrio phage 1.262.O._10N.286.51.A9]
MEKSTKDETKARQIQAILDDATFNEVVVNMKANYLLQMSQVDDEETIKIKRKLIALEEMLGTMSSSFKDGF